MGEGGENYYYYSVLEKSGKKEEMEAKGIRSRDTSDVTRFLSIDVHVLYTTRSILLSMASEADGEN